MNLVTALSLGRIAVGVLSVARPDDAARVLQLDPSADPQLGFLQRLFGTREIALGVVTLLVSGRARTGLVLAGIAVDAADAATGHLAGKDGIVPAKAATLMTVVGAGAAVGGLLGLRVKRKTVVTTA